MKRQKRTENGQKRLNVSKETKDKLRETPDLTPHEYTCTCNCENLLPGWFPWLAVIATVAIRINYVSQPQNWWILHPDEVFQSVEVAFSEVYGFGFYPYEYLPPPTNISTDGEKQQAAVGMYSLRSFLYPKAFVVAMETARLLKFSLNPVVVCRIFNVLITSTLPLAVYMFVRRLLRCQLVSSIACVLTASSVHLTVFGTHCIVNSFTAPFVFFGLFLCLPSQLNTTLSSLTKLNQGKVAHTDENSSCKTVRKHHSVQSSRLINGITNKTKIDLQDKAPISAESQYSPRPSADSVNCHLNNFPNLEGNNTNSKSKCDKNSSYEDNNNSKMEDDLDSELKCNNNIVVSEGKNKGIFERREQCISITSQTCCRYIFGGFLITVVCYIRVELVLFFSVIYVSVLGTDIKVFLSTYSDNLRREIVLLISGGISGLCICLWYDYGKYGSFIIPPFQWIKFNLLSNTSFILFGSKVKSTYMYTGVLFYNRIYDLIFVLVTFLYCYNYIFGKKNTVLQKRSIALQISFLVLLLCYSSVGHKEARFLHNFIVLYVVLISYGLHILIEVASNYKAMRKNIFAGLVLFLCCFCLNSYYSFPSTTDESTKEWTYKNATTSKDVNICLDFISNTPDVRGIMLDTSIFDTHGFSILRHDVPILTKMHNEYHLYKKYGDGYRLANRKIRILNRYSDYVSILNPHYLSKLLGSTNTFNFVVTKRLKFFSGMKYKEVFKSGDFFVLVRNLTDYHEKKLNKMANELPLGNNATILEYETSWLLTSGLYELAAERAKRSLEIDQSRVRVFQQLMVAYSKANEWKEVEKYQNLCFRFHGQGLCETNQEKVVLHEPYRQFELN